MRVSLAFPPFYLESLYNLPPLGIINLATVLSDAGHESTVHDFVLDIRQGSLAMGPDMYRQCARAILDAEPDVAAFSAQCATYPPLVQIARELKRQRPDLSIVVGGHNASFVDEATLARVPEIDIMARGEGEVTMVEMASTLAKGYDESALGDVAGLTFRGAGGAITRTPERDLIDDLNTLPLPDYSYVPSISAYREACDMSRNIAILEVGRGCPHACVYCSESSFWRRKVRTFSGERMVNEMKHLRDNHGADCFVLSFDQFTADKDFVRDFCGRVIDEGLNQDTSWYCISRLDTVDDALLGLMREAGLESLCYGIDSGSAKTLSFINKQIDPGLLFTRVAETTKHGIVPTLSFIIGFPHEEREDIDASLELALSCVLQGNVSPLVQMPTVLAGTELHARYANDLVREVDTYFALGLEFDSGKRLVMDEELINADAPLFSSFYNLKCRGVSNQELGQLADNFPLILNLYPKSFLLLSKALGASASQLFGRFLEFVAAAQDREVLTLSAPECFRHFPEFATRALEDDGVQPGTWNHLRAMLDYETAGLQAAEPVASGIKAHEAYSGPRLLPNTLVRGISCDIAAVLADMRADTWLASYPEQPTVMVFAQRDGQLEVTEINDFGLRFLELCDGGHSIEDIAAALRPEFGPHMDHSAFSQSCQDAVETFRTLRMVETEPITTP